MGKWRRFACVFAMLLAVCVCAPARAQGLDISVTQDKLSHQKGEVAVLTVDIVNNTGATVRNLRIENILPQGLVYVDEAEASRTVAELAPGARVQHAIHVKLLEVNLPQTGDPAQPWLWGLLALICGGYLAVRGRRRAA